MRLYHFYSALLLLACSDTPQLSDQSAALIEEGLRIGGRNLPPTAPVFVDVATFRRLDDALGLSENSGDRRSLRGHALRSSKWADVVHCEAGNVDCEVAEDGIFIRVDSVRLQEPTLAVGVTYAFTVRTDTSLYGVCTMPATVVFARRDSVWQLVETLPGRRC